MADEQPRQLHHWHKPAHLKPIEHVRIFPSPWGTGYVVTHEVSWDTLEEAQAYAHGITKGGWNRTV